MIQQLLFGLLIGVSLLLVAPAMLRSVDKSWASWVGNAYASIAMQTLHRPAISVSPHSDLSLRRRSFDDIYGSETVSVGGQLKRVTKIPNSVHRWGKRRFTFVDEKFGSTFDLRDVLIGRLEHERRKDGEMVYKDIEFGGDGQPISAQTYVRMFFEAGKRPRSLSMDLEESIHPITDGAEDAAAWERVREAVKRMFLGYQEQNSVLKLALPMLGLVGGFFAGFYLFGPGALPGSSGGSTISVGASSLSIFGSLRGEGDGDSRGNQLIRWLSGVQRRTWIGAVLFTLIGLVAVFGLLVSPVGTVALIGGVIIALVAVTLGSVAVVSALPAIISEPIGELWMTLSLKAFVDPVIHQREDKTYAVSEADDLEWDDTGERYRFCKSWVGFTCDVSPQMFGQAGVKGSRLGQYRDMTALADGGRSPVPEGLEPTSKITHANHKGVVPSHDALSDFDLGSTFVRTDRWLARFADSSTGKIVEKAQQEATKEFADGEPPFGDRAIMIMSLVLMVIGLGLSFVIWGLL